MVLVNIVWDIFPKQITVDVDPFILFFLFLSDYSFYLKKKMHGNTYDPSHKSIPTIYQYHPIYCQGTLQQSHSCAAWGRGQIQPFCKKQIPRMQQNQCGMENRKKSKSSLKAKRGYGFIQHAKSFFYSESLQCLTCQMSLQIAFDFSIISVHPHL